MSYSIIAVERLLQRAVKNNDRVLYTALVENVFPGALSEWRRERNSARRAKKRKRGGS